MTSNSNIDYVKTNFEYSVLTKVNTSPTYESLKKIKNELKANAATVPSDLGGGGHGHLRGGRGVRVAAGAALVHDRFQA